MTINLEQLLLERHRPPEWAAFTELANGTGASSTRRIDVAAFNCWPSKGYLRIAYEVKRTRADFMRELANPKKREDAERYFHECWFVTMRGVCEPREIPEGWGLLVPTKKGDKLRKALVARQRRPEPMPERLWVAAVRRGAEKEHTVATRTYQFAGEVVTQADLHARVKQAVSAQEEVLAMRSERLEQQQRAIRDQRESLLEPLRVLASEARGSHFVRQEELTADNVREWIAAVRSGIDARTIKTLTNAREALGEILEGMPK
jgi:hypothetical protein